MTIQYISIDISSVPKEFISTVISHYKTAKYNRSLVYYVKDDIYFLSSIPNESVEEATIQLACDTQEEFIQKVQEYKLLKLLG